MKRIIMLLLSLCFGLSVFLRGGTMAYAAENDLVITEIMYNPAGSDTDHEWVEIYNNGSNAVVLIVGSGTDGLRLVDGGSNRTLKTTAAMGSMTVEPHSFAVLAQNTTTFLTDYPSFSGNLIEASALSLANTTDMLALRIGSSGVIWSEITYDSAWGGNGDGTTLAKVDTAGGNDSANWTIGVSGGTPGAGYAVAENKTPIAAFNHADEIMSGTETNFNASDSTDEDGQIVSYLWDFGDSQTTETANPQITHLYAENGQYLVILTVTDNGSATAQAQKTVIVTSPAPTPVAAHIELSEFLAAPGNATDWDKSGKADSTDEWVELYNAGPEQVDLGGYALDDIESGGSAVFIIPDGTLVESHEYVVFYRKDTKLALNNDGDSLRLLDQSGSAVEVTNYTITHADTSWAKDERGVWVEDQSPTPVAANKIEETEEEPEDEEEEQEPVEESEPEIWGGTIALFKQQPLETVGVIEGQLTVAEGVLGENSFYIQDESGGIQVVFENGNNEFTLGKNVQITGKLKQAYQEFYLKAESIEPSEKTFTASPIKINTVDVGEKLEGSLVEVIGKIVKTSGSIFYLDDGSGKIKISIKKSTGIEKPKMKTGEWFSVIGILSQYDDSYRILPRYQNDVMRTTKTGEVLGEYTNLPKTGFSCWRPFFGFSVMFFGYMLRRLDACWR